MEIDRIFSLDSKKNEIVIGTSAEVARVEVPRKNMDILKKEIECKNSMQVSEVSEH